MSALVLYIPIARCACLSGGYPSSKHKVILLFKHCSLQLDRSHTSIPFEECHMLCRMTGQCNQPGSWIWHLGSRDSN